MNKAYLVTCDGYHQGWGAEIYAVGVFDTKEQAKACAEENNGTIVELEVNKVYPLIMDDSGNEHNSKSLGGYIE